MKRRLLKGLVYTTLVAALLIGACFLVLRLGYVNDIILAYAKKEFESSTGWHLNAASIDRLSPFSLRLKQVELTCPGSATITADRISFTFAPHQLMLGKVVFPSISIHDVEILPAIDYDQTPSCHYSQPSAPFILPLSIEVGKLRITNLRIPEVWRNLLPADQYQPPQAINIIGKLQASLLHKTGLLDLSIEDVALPEYPTTAMISAYYEAGRLHVNTRIAEENRGALHHTTGALASYSIEFFAHTSTQLDASLQGQCHSEGQIVISCTASVEDSEDTQPMGLLGDITSLEGFYCWLPGESLKVHNIVAESRRRHASAKLQGALEMDGSLELQNALFDLTLSNLADAKDISPISISGSAEAKGTITGPWNSPFLDVEVKTYDLTVSEKHLGDVHLQGEVSCSSDSLMGSLALCCQVGPIATNSTFDLYWDFGPRVSLHDLHWQSPTAALKGNVDLWTPTMLLSGHLEGETGDLAWLVPQSLGEVHGTGLLSVELLPDDAWRRQTVDIKLDMEGLVTPNASSDRLNIIGHFDNFFDTPYGTIKVAARDVKAGTIRLKELIVETTLPADGGPWQYSVDANGRWESKFRLKATGSATPLATSPIFSIDTLSGKLQGFPILLTEPLRIIHEDNKTSIDSFALKVGKGQIAGSGIYGADTNLSLHIYDLPMEIVKDVVPQAPMHGKVTGSFAVNGSPDNPNAQFHLSVNDVIVSSDGLLNIPPLRGRAEGILSDRILTAKGDVSGIGEKPVTISLQLPLHLSLAPLEAEIPHDLPLRATIDAAGEVLPLLHIFSTDASNISGKARVAMEITGTYQEPLVNGTLDLKDARYEGIDTGSVFRNIQAQFEGRGKEIALTRMTAEDLHGGTVIGRGSIKLDPAHKYPFDIAFNLSNTQILQGDYAQATASGELHLAGNLENVELRGSITTNSLIVTLPKEMPTAAASLDITFVNSPKNKQTLSHLPEAKNHRPIKLNIRMEIPNSAYLRSDDLLSEWSGTINITGSASAPLLNGELRVVNGDYRLNGKTFILDKGSILFAGDFEKKTSIYVVARQDIDRYTIEAVLKGPIRDPQLALRSHPHLSQREILSWIIFNRPLNDITSLENDQAGQAVVDLSNRPSSATTDIMSRLRRLGIDHIEFTTDPDADSQDVSVNIGKYLFKDVYISLNKGLTTESNSVRLEANVIRNVKFQAEVDNEAAGGVSLMWKRDY